LGYIQQAFNALIGYFAKQEGWNEKKRILFFVPGFTILNKYTSVPVKFHSLAYGNGLQISDFGYFCKDSINYAVKIFKDNVNKVLDKEQPDEIGFSGHSLGALISRDYVTKYVPEDKYLQKITKYYFSIAGPHKGSKWANRTFPLTKMLQWTSCRDMMVGSEYLKELNERSFPKGIEVVAFIGGKDWIVPRESARIEGYENIEYPEKDHYTILLDPEVTKFMKDCMENNKENQSSQS